MRRQSAAFLCALMMLAAGAPAAAAGGRGGDDPIRAPVVELIEPGAEPRTALRLTPSEGDDMTLTMTMRFGVEQTVGGRTSSVPQPPIRYEMAMRITEVNRRGRFTYTFAGTDVAAVDDGSVDAALLEELDRALDPLVDLEGEATVTARGVAVSTELDIPDELDPAVRTVMEQLSEQLASNTIPFPRPQVGVGAAWTATMKVDAGGIESEIVTRYQLVELTGSRYALDVSYDQTAEPQDVDLPGAPESADVTLEQSDISGSGRLTGDLSVIGGSGTIMAAGEQVLAVEAGGESDEIRQSLSLEVDVEIKRPGEA